MSDESLRRSQRERELDPDEEVRWLSERLRSGALTQERLELAAALGHPGAQVLAPQEAIPDEPDDFAEWLGTLERWGAGCLVRAGLALLGEVPLRTQGSTRFDGPDDRLLAAHELLARWARSPGQVSPAALQAVQQELTEVGYGYGMLAALNCAFALLRIPVEPELGKGLLRDAATAALQRVGLDQAKRVLARELWPWALGEHDPLERVLGGRGDRWMRLDGLTRALVWSDAELLWTASSHGELLAFDAAGQRALELPRRERDVYAFACGPEGRVAVGELGGACMRWRDPRQPGIPFEVEGEARALAFSPDGAWLWAGTSKGRVVGLDLARDGAQTSVEVNEGSVTSLCFVGDELWAGARGGWLIGLAAGGQELRRIGPLEHDVEALSALPDGRLVVACNTSLRVFDPATGAELGALEAHRSRLHDLARVPGTSQVVSVGGDGDLAWSDPQAGRVLRRWETPSVLLACAVHPEGGVALSGARTGLVRRHALEV